MEVQIKKCLISMRKIANLTNKSRIDTTNGDVDEFTESTYATLHRMLWDSRGRAIRMLIKKFSEIKEITKFIMESNKFTGNLRTIQHSLVKTKEGLTLYKSNPRYINDMKVKSTVEHLLEDDIPCQIATITEYVSRHKIEDADVVELDVPDAPELP
jgi:hypothetical protein